MITELNSTNCTVQQLWDFCQTALKNRMSKMSKDRISQLKAEAEKAMGDLEIARDILESDSHSINASELMSVFVVIGQIMESEGTYEEHFKGTIFIIFKLLTLPSRFWEFATLNLQKGTFQATEGKTIEGLEKLLVDEFSPQ